MEEKPLISGVDKKPFIEVTNHEYDESRRWTQGLTYLALSSVALVGVRFASNITLNIDPSRLSYLTQGLGNWWEVAGYQLDATGKTPVRLRDFALEGIKRVEETMGGIPRTFGLFGYASAGTLTTPASRLTIPPEALVGARSHYETLLGEAGHTLTPEDMIRGFKVQPHEGRPALFRLAPDSSISGDPLISDVDIRARRWQVEKDSLRDAEGRLKYQHVIKETEVYSDIAGAKPISRNNEFRYVVTKATGKPKISGVLREALEPFLNVDKLESKINIPPEAHKVLQGAQVFGKRMTERYMRVLDSPLEFIEEVVYGGPSSERGLLKKSIESKPYSFFKNVLGAGGDYSGTALDLWGRHISRLLPIVVGGAAAYEVGSAVTNLFFGRNLEQMGGEAVAAGERTYAGISDLTGLTALNKYQKDKAEGSHRLLGVMAFPLSGALTGWVAAGLTNKLATPEGVFPWAHAREAVHDAPAILQKAEKVPLLGKLFGAGMTRGAKFAGIGGAIGGLLSLPFLIGSLGSGSSYREVAAEQSGEAEVSIKKGRFWESGKSDIEGEGEQIYTEGWYRRLMNEGIDDLNYGDYADRPFSRMIKGVTDPYYIEKEMYHERPYPIATADDSFAGPLGPIWAATIGRVLKPTKYMHADETSAGGLEGIQQGEAIQYGKDVSQAPGGDLRSSGPAPALTPLSPSFTAGETIYRASDAAGLPGYILSEALGSDSWWADKPVLASSSDIGNMRNSFWDWEIGGGAMTSEGIRRFLPKDRTDIQTVNPIANDMPAWLPGADYFQGSFLEGDPYSGRRMKERLPGPGFASRFPELEDVPYEEYPDIFKYKILADVARSSDEFKEVAGRVKNQADSGELPYRDQAIYAGTQAQLLEREKKLSFRGEPEGILGNYWAGLTSAGHLNPVEHLLPTSPVHKSSGPVSPIQTYEEREVYSKTSPQWNKPISDFILPAARTAVAATGVDFIPAPVQEERDLKQYFDILDYTKAKKLEGAAREQGEGRAAFAFARKAEFTMYGADPYADVETVEKVIPREEKPYFREFVAEDDPEVRKRVLEASPAYMKKFYMAQWQKKLYGFLASKDEISDQESEAMQAIEASRALEGQSASMDMFGDYYSGVQSGDIRPNTFPDFIRAKRLEGYFEEESPFNAPASDWIGYNPGANMDSIKLKVVQAEGLDHHDFDLWEDDSAQAERDLYAAEGARDLMNGPGEDPNELSKSLMALRLRDLDVQFTSSPGDKTRIVLDLAMDKRGEIKRQLELQGIRYGVDT